MAYLEFPERELPPSIYKWRYGIAPKKISSAEFAANVLPLISSGPQLVLIVVEKTKEEIKDEEEKTNNDRFRGEKVLLSGRYVDEADSEQREALMGMEELENDKTRELEGSQSQQDNSNKKSLLESFLDIFPPKQKEVAAPKLFTISQPLLKKHSPYWAKRLDVTHKTTELLEIKCIPGIVSSESVSMLFHWLHREDVTWNGSASKIKNDISDVINLAQLAEHWQITDINLEHHLAFALKRIVNMHCNRMSCKYFTDSHIKSVFSLREGHLLQDLFAMAAVEPYFCNDTYKYVPKILNYVSGTEILLQVCNPPFVPFLAFILARCSRLFS